MPAWKRLTMLVSVFADRRQPWQPGYAVRLDWQDGTHSIAGFRLTERAAQRVERRIAAYWRPGPWRPRCSLVAISYRDWRLHARRRDCRSPDCPGAASARLERAGVRR